MKFSFQTIKHSILAPGNIFWQKRDGSKVLLNEKGDVLNFNLIKRLDEASSDLSIEDEIDFSIHAEVKALYEKYSEEVLMRKKIIWRDKLIEVMVKEFIKKENNMQSELNQIAWSLFSSFEFTEAIVFIERDSNLFKRNLSVASSYTFCAFLLGYYEPYFLNRLFNTTLKNLMSLGASERVFTLKEKLEYLRMQDSFSEEDFEYIKEIASTEIISKTVVFEKYDGSGMRNLNSREMSDLEVVFIALSEMFSYSEATSKNALLAIHDGSLNCQTRTLKMLQGVLNKKENEAAELAA